MTPEEIRALQEALRALREKFEKMPDVGARMDAIEAQLKSPNAKEVDVRSQLDTLDQQATEMREALETMKRENRQRSLSLDPAQSKQEALRMFGMQIRQDLCRALRTEVPARFRAELDQLKVYREQRASLEATAGTSGANIIPTMMEQSLLDTLEEVSSLLNDVDFQPNLPGKMDLPTLTSRPTLMHKRATVDTAMAAGAATIGSVSFDPNEMYMYIPIDNRLIDMTPLALASIVMQLMRDGTTEGLVNDLLNADGTSTYNSMTGILKESEAAYIYSMAAGKTAFADLDDVSLQAIMAKTLKRGRARGKWYMAQDVYFNITNIDRNGKVPLVTFNGQNGAPMVLGRQVEIDEGMPGVSESAADTPFFAFGDLKTVLVGLTDGIQMAASEHVLFNKNQTAFRIVLNGDIVRKPVATLITGRTAAE